MFASLRRPPWGSEPSSPGDGSVCRLWSVLSWDYVSVIEVKQASAAFLLPQPLYSCSDPPCRTTIAQWPANFCLTVQGQIPHSSPAYPADDSLPSLDSLKPPLFHFSLFSSSYSLSYLSLSPSLWLCVSAESACLPSSLSNTHSETHSHTSSLNRFINLLPFFSPPDLGCL